MDGIHYARILGIRVFEKDNSISRLDRNGYGEMTFRPVGSSLDHFAFSPQEVLRFRK